MVLAQGRHRGLRPHRWKARDDASQPARSRARPRPPCIDARSLHADPGGARFPQSSAAARIVSCVHGGASRPGELLLWRTSPKPEGSMNSRRRVLIIVVLAVICAVATPT